MTKVEDLADGLATLASRHPGARVDGYNNCVFVFVQIADRIDLPEGWTYERIDHEWSQYQFATE